MSVFSSQFAFSDAFMTGANDIANSFSSAVGAGTLTNWQAVAIAAAFEFVGAVVMGGNVASTIRDGIINASSFDGEPALLMYALMSASVTTTTWLGTATYFELPVSTTQATVAALVGIGWSLKGADTVNWWSQPEEGKVIATNVGSIVISWFAAPVFSSVAANIFYIPLRSLVLRSEHSYSRVFKAFPIVVFIVITVLMAMIFNKGGDEMDKAMSDFDTGGTAGLAFGCGGFAGLVAIFFMPKLKRHVDYLYTLSKSERQVMYGHKSRAEKDAEDAAADGEIGRIKSMKDYTWTSSYEDLKDALRFDDPERSFMQKLGHVFVLFWKWVFDFKPSYVVYSQEGQQSKIGDLHLNREEYDEKSETALSFLQILSCIFAAFSHGANDIANAVGPLSGAWTLYKDGKVGTAADQTKGILAYGAAGMVIGLALYGSRCMAVLGTKLAALTPSRGLSVELGYSLVIVFAASYSLPVSTTLTQTGAVMGVGLTDRAVKGVNWREFAKIFSGWIVNVVVAALLGGAIVSFGAFSPAHQDVIRSSLKYNDHLEDEICSGT